MKSLIKTGLKSLDQKCSDGGHLIVIFGTSGSGKTSIINSIKRTAKKNKESFFSCEVNDDFSEQLRLCNNNSKIKLIDINYCDNRNDNCDLIKFRENLVIKNQWAIITIPSNHNGNGIFYDEVDHLQIFRIADYIFKLSRNCETGVSDVENLKNRLGVDESNFQIEFKPLTIVVPIAEEINHVIAK